MVNGSLHGGSWEHGANFVGMSVMAILESARGSGEAASASSAAAFLASSLASSVSIWRRRIAVLSAGTSASAARALFRTETVIADRHWEESERGMCQN